MKKLYSAVLSLSAHYSNRNTVIKGIVVLMMLVGCQVGFGQKYWDGGAGDGLWGSSTNWVGDVLPTGTDQVILDNLHGVGGTYTVTLPAGNVTTSLLQLTISPSASNNITLILPQTNTAAVGLGVGSFIFPIDIVILNGGVLKNSSGATPGTGVVGIGYNSFSSTRDSLQIQNGGKYIHNTLVSSGRTAPHLSTALGTENGIYEYDVPGFANYDITSGTTYGNLTLTRSAGAATYTASGGSVLNVAGSLTINSAVTFTSSMTAAFNLYGDLANSGTAATFSITSPMNFMGTGTQTISGSGATSFLGTTTITNTTNTLAIVTSAPINFNGAVTAHGNLKIISGLMSGSGAWTYDIGRTLTFGNTASYPATTANNVAKWWPIANGPANVTMNGAGGITMNVPRTITGNLDLTSGVITTSSVLTLNPSVAGTGYTGGSNVSYIDGKLEKIGNYAPFKFPVGKVINGATAMVPIDILIYNASDPTDSYTVEYKRASAYTISSALPIGLNNVCHLDYWSLDRTVATPLSANVSIRAYWTSQSSNGGSPAFITGVSSMVLAQTISGGTWNFGAVLTGLGSNAAGSVDWTSWANPTVASNFFSLASTNLDNPLPVTVSYLQGAKQNTGNLINWKVSCISNLNATMILQRSTDNRNFTDITSITATAARCQQPFDYTDIAPASGTNYYRLKTINDDGKITYSIVIVIVNKATGFDIVSLLPNLVSSNALLNISSAQKTSLQIVITDAMGRPVQKTAYSLIAGSNQFEISVANLPAGMYRITGTTAEGLIKTIAFVKQ